MKKIIYIVFIILISKSVFANETIATIEVDIKQYNVFIDSFLDSKLGVGFVLSEDQGEMFVLVMPSNIESTVYVFRSSDIKTLQNVLNKYLEWCAIAEKNSTKTYKEIPIQIIPYYSSYMGGKFYAIMNDMNAISAKMYSLSVGHSLKLIFPELKDRENMFITWESEDILLSKNSVKQIQKFLSRDNLDKALQKYEKQKEHEDNLFK